MYGFIGLVLCKHPRSSKNYLFEIPSYAMLKEGDSVVVDTSQGEEEAEVIAVLDSIDPESKYFEFIVKSCKAQTPLKRVLRRKRIVLEDFHYSDEGGDEDA